MFKTIILGDEYDDGLKYRLIEALKSMGAKFLSSDLIFGGSQELTSLEVNLRGEIVKIESETFIGLSISGPDILIDEIVILIDK